MTAPTTAESVAETAFDFLRRHPPFDRMREDAVRAMAGKLSCRQFAKDATILSAQSGRVSELHIVLRGLVGRRPNDTHPELDRTLGPGELFPVGALSVGGTTTKIFAALSDASCYLLPRADFLALRAQSPEFEAFCTQAITDTLRQSLESLYRQYSQRAAEQETLTRSLGELVVHTPVTCLVTATLREAAQKMADEKVRTIVVAREDGVPVGMLTLVDMLQRVVLPQRSLDAPVSAVMSSPIVTLPASATAYEAVHVMAERAIRQVVVVENGRLRGVVNERDVSPCAAPRCATSSRTALGRFHRQAPARG